MAAEPYRSSTCIELVCLKCTDPECRCDCHLPAIEDVAELMVSGVLEPRIASGQSRRQLTGQPNFSRYWLEVCE